MFRSLRGSTAAKNAPPPTMYTQPAFAGKKSAFAPPPVRRVSAATPVPATPEPEEDAQLEPGEEVAAGEWAEALYDYTSEVRLLFSFLWVLTRVLRSLKDASDLNLRAGERVWVTEQTSDDWCAYSKLSAPHPRIFILSYTRWTGEIDGRSGLFPTAYVKLL